MIRLDHIHVRVGTVDVLRDVSLELAPATKLCILSPSGSGKTLMWELLAAMRNPTSGTVEIDGISLQALPVSVLQLYRSRLGLIAQKPQLLAHLTVAENIALPLEHSNVNLMTARKMVANIMRKLDLQAVADARIPSLTASQTMLTTIARALVNSPAIIVADEPLLLLDTASAQRVVNLLLEHSKRGASLLVFSRDPHTARSLGCEVATLSNGVLTQAADRSSSPAELSRMQPRAESQPMHHEDDERFPADSLSTTQERTSETRKIRITAINSNL